MAAMACFSVFSSSRSASSGKRVAMHEFDMVSDRIETVAQKAFKIVDKRTIAICPKNDPGKIQNFKRDDFQS